MFGRRSATPTALDPELLSVKYAFDFYAAGLNAHNAGRCEEASDYFRAVQAYLAQTTLGHTVRIDSKGNFMPNRQPGGHR